MNDNDNYVSTDPDILLSAIARQQGRKKGGRLHLFIGMAPGVGKTYAMLQAAREAKRNGIDVVAGVVETHARKDTELLLNDIEIIPKKKLYHRGLEFLEMDLDTVLERKPNIVLVDELAHTNIPGSRHLKRWQDVFELLDAGINVYSTINIQHLESRKETVEKIAQITIFETVPDSVLDRAFQIQLIDLSVPDLLKRLKEGKIYLGDKVQVATDNFFKEEKLTALREIALRVVAERVDADLQTFVAQRQAGSSFGAVDYLMVAVGFSPSSETIIRATRKLASNLDAAWIAAHVTCNELASENEKALLKKNLDLARNLNAEVITIADTNVVDALIRIAKQKDVSQIIVGRSRKKFFRDIFGQGSTSDQLIKKSALDINVIGPVSHRMSDILGKIDSIKIKSSISSFAKSSLFTFCMLTINALLVYFIGYRAVGFLLLLGILVIGLFLPLGSVLFASIISIIGWIYFFIPPIYTLHIRESEDIFLCISFFVAALATGILTRRIKYQQDILTDRELRVQTLNNILIDIASATNTRELCLSVIKRIANFLSGECNIILLKKDQSLTNYVGPIHIKNTNHEMAVAKWVLENNKAAGRFTDTLSSAEALYIPLKGSFSMVGVLAYRTTAVTTLSVEDFDFLFAVSRQIAISLEKQEFHKKIIESDRLAESKKIQQTLLQLLAGETIAILNKNNNRADLIFTIDNFLLISRLLLGIFPLKKDYYDTYDIVKLAINKIKDIYPKKLLKININSRDNLPKLNIEKDSVIQSLANILLNAVQYAPDKEIDIQLKPGEIIICDHGPGIKEEDLGRVFEKFYRSKDANVNHAGHGLGLAVAKGIITSHEGRILLTNRPTGGLMVNVTLPIEQRKYYG